ncbi:type IV secretory system conjugative DNA transfer family protein [Nocardia terpenica]|uniref:TraD/TraG TraM recognition site domain-containing protein n=1 Tax=Nocardia terpenica TaxID=455432 RepID=A0A164JIE4_9NOCA|nr:TraM recognition domain-containing protein [Nocardia terpenica]KZM70432.1 hypothetical protein AWN90_03895 [Nocardia terpenica]NQE91114.1 TraM recognition domain-containing protein [Nocardia terpenica]
MSPRETRRRSTGGLGEETWLLIIFLAGVAFALAAWVALSLGSWWAGLPVDRHPVGALLGVILGRHRWPWQSSLIGAGIAAAATGVGIPMWRRWPRSRGIDAAARTMASPRTITMARGRDNAAAAARLLADAPAAVRQLSGPPLGRTVLGGVELFVTAEQSVFVSAGQRTGKTTAWAIPAVLSAWGPVLATSNKPDLYRHTVGGRSDAGRVWLCDLQAVTGKPQLGFWLNLLKRTPSLPKARRLAEVFVSATGGTAAQQANAKVDSYFDGGAQELLALYMFAAALAEGDLVHVSEWLSHDQDQTAALILRHHRRHRAAERILEAQNLYARQRDGLYDMARRFLNVLSDEEYARMVTPPTRKRLTAYEADEGKIVIDAAPGETVHNLPELDIAAFVGSTDTLYALSMTGPDSASPLTAAVIAQIIDAGLEQARARVAGRLAVPLLAVLDEAANCARIGQLPEYYTYCAGCGLILMTIVQVLEQAEELWGARGLATMRAQSIEIYGGNIAIPDYLEGWAKLIDEHDVADRTRTTGPGGAQKTLSWRAEPILNVAKLGALPPDRALIRLPGHEPLLIEKVPWWDLPIAPVVEQSLALFSDSGVAAPAPRTGSGGAPGGEGVEL